MLVEPGSLCWVGGRMVEARDGQTWAVEFARFCAQRRRPGQWQRPGQRAEAGACPGCCAARTAGSRGFAGQSFTRSARVAVPCGKPGPRLAVPWSEPRWWLEGVGPVGPCGRIADGPRHTDKPPVASGRGTSGSGDGRREGLEADPIRLRFLHARRPLQRSATGPGGGGGGAARLERSGMRKTRRLLLRRESFTFLHECNGVWLSWDWTPTSCRPCWTWKACSAKPGDCRSQRPGQPRHGLGRWPARSNWRRQNPTGRN